MRFAKDVLSVISVLRPRTVFIPQNCQDLVMVHTRGVMPSAIADALLSSLTSRLDIIWDMYPDDNHWRNRATHVPRYCNKFLSNSKSKVLLYVFLSEAVIESSSHFMDVMICSTYSDLFLINTSHSQSTADSETIIPCNHQEAYSRTFIQHFHAAQQGYSKPFIQTVDSYVVIVVAFELEKPSSTSQLMKPP